MLKNYLRWRVVLGCSALLSLAGYTQVIGHPTRVGPSALLIADSTVSGAVQVHNAAVDVFASTLGNFVWDGGMLTDELRAPLNGKSIMPRGAPATWNFAEKDIWRRLSAKDVRILPERLSPRSYERLTPLDTATNQMGIGYPYREGSLDLGYLKMQGARAWLSTAIGQLATTPPHGADRAVVKVFRGELYALEGYSDILLADLFCSGVPLNTFAEVGVSYDRVIKAGNEEAMEWSGDAYQDAIAKKQVVYHPGSTTTQVYQDAIAKFDTALTLARGSARILNLARVGKGRAWLALGQYDSAAAAVAHVSNGFGYSLRSEMNLDPDGDENVATVADRKGRNGLPYISSWDPRIETGWIITDKSILRVKMPTKWWRFNDFSDPLNAYVHGGVPRRDDPDADDGPSSAFIPLTLASWEEAVLIKAEAALHTKHKRSTNPTWLRLLNQLRATAPIPGTTRPALPKELPPLVDPGDSPHDSARVALLFSERAYWLFLTGHRQGDMRRLVRQYGWSQEQVYPTGPYVLPKGVIGMGEYLDYFGRKVDMPHGVIGQVGQYGTDVNMPIPPQERENPYFHGCLDRSA